MRRVLAPFSSLAFVGALAVAAWAQGNPPAPVPSPSPSAAGAPAAGPAAPATAATPPPAGASTPPAVPTALPSPGESPSPPAESPSPLATPTQPPIIVEPPQVSVEPSKTVSARINSALGEVTAAVADPTIATAVVDQAQRVLYVTGVKVGTTTVTVTDSRGVTRAVGVLVAYAAGSVADQIALRVTGNPASAQYLREAIAQAVSSAATLRSGANVTLPETIPVRGDLSIDDRIEVDAQVQLAGNGYLPVSGVTHVMVENVALPAIQPARLLVSDYPERLTANGVLFTARLDRTQAQRFLYYHYNPATEPARRILLKAENTSNAPATVQLIEGDAGPESNEMEVGHLSTKRFLVRSARNEGRVVTIAPGTTLNLVDHLLPPQNVVSAILQLRLVTGDPVQLALVAQDALAPVDQTIDQTQQLLAGGALHARGVYPVPTFYFNTAYDVDGDDLDIPIGQLPLPNLRQGEALSGDYGVEQVVEVVISNMTRGPKAIALYANPRGGRATGTFIIDGTVVQAHALPAFSRFKIWQETIRSGTYRRIRVVTMPEGGSSYPLRLTFAQDDGSVAPGAPGSPIY